MSAINYSVRAAGGGVSYGQTSELDNHQIPFFVGSKIALNLSPADVIAYTRSGSDLLVTLANGEVVTIQGFFLGENHEDRELLLSESGEIHRVDFGAMQGDTYLVTYEGIDTTGKWSAYDNMVFLDLERVEPVVAPLVAPFLGGLGLAGAAVGGAAVVNELLGGGGGTITPTVDDPEVDRIVGGTSDGDVTITGTGEEGSTVVVTVGDTSVTTTVGEDGTWSVLIGGDDLPADGIYEAEVVVTAPDDTVYDLDGPTVDIDTTPPEASVTEGTLSVGETVNAEEMLDGHIILGAGEPGATITVTIEGIERTATVGSDGTWQVHYETGVLSGGEYESGITITSTDARGNTTVVTDTLSVDTIAPDVDLNTVEGDNIINAAEASDGITLSGTGEAGASLTVSFQGSSQTVVIGSNGTWSVDISASGIAAGTYDSAVTLTAVDAAGNSTTNTYTLEIDTEGAVTLTQPIEGDNLINQAELSDGVVLSGTAEAGAAVQVTLQGVTRSVTAGSDGNWTASFAAGELPQGEYDATVTVTATDLVGNSETTTGTVRVDTTTSVALATPIASDGMINALEASAGATLTGTAEAGASVQVTLQGVTHTVTAGSNGAWSTTFSTAEIPAGTYQAAVTVTSTDLAGNTASTSGTVQVDTEISADINPAQAGGDDILNAQEHAAGLTLTGTGEAGATVTVMLEGVSKTATVGSNGSWSVTYGSGEVPGGEYDTTVTATVTDLAGNSATATHDLRVDTTTAATVEVAPATIGGDNFVNASELNNGITLGGTAEPGASVSVEVEGVIRTTTADSNGNWSVTYEKGSLPSGTYSTTATVTTMDAVGNTATSSTSFDVDTEVTNPVVKSVTFSDDNVSAVSLETDDSSFTISSLNGDGSSTELSPFEVPLGGSETMFAFSPSVSDGTHLMISATDDAGNRSDTMLILDDNATNSGTLDHAQAGNFQIEAIELDYASDAALTLTEAQIRDLSDTSDTLTIHGGSDDQITVAGAVKTTEVRSIDGEDYDVYTLGDDGVTLVVDQDINVII